MTKTTTKITPIILSGGQGVRLWPLSRSNKPKQFIPLLNKKTLFEETIARCGDKEIFNAPTIICAQRHRFIVRNILTSCAPQDTNIIMEPFGRDTAAAISIAALSANDPDDVILMLPSDHLIPDLEKFNETVRKSLPLAANGHIVALGIKPTSAHTGFGYIERGAEEGVGYKVKTFHEKPTLKKAEKYISNSDYYWNAGIFMMQAKTLISEIEKYAPDILSSARDTWNARKDDLGDVLLDPTEFKKVRKQSIDYAVLEKTDRAAVVPAEFEWNDLGSWESLWRVSKKDKKENVVKGTIFSHDVKESYLHSEGPALAVLGLEDIIAVASSDAVFIAPKSRSEEVKKLVEDMQNSDQVKITKNITAHRPWGSYEVIEDQSRSEHWVVTKGEATVTRDNDVFVVPVNNSVYIPNGAYYRLENKSTETLELVEIQTGSYLGVDDITRLDDNNYTTDTFKQEETE